MVLFMQETPYAGAKQALAEKYSELGGRNQEILNEGKI